MSNDFDKRIDEVLQRIGRLLRKHGFFHAKVHFSSGQVTLWSVRDPYNYQVCDAAEFLSRGFTSRFETVAYPINARIPPQKVSSILSTFKSMRLSDRSGDFRAGSLNIFNGRIGLNFASGGNRYLDYREFLRDASPDHRRRAS